jgi:hypothetical protein
MDDLQVAPPFVEGVSFPPATRSRDAVTETRGDDGTTVAGRKKISEFNNYEMRRRSTSSSTLKYEGVSSVPEMQRSKSATTKSMDSKKTRRAKRSGYNHAAAKTSDPNMLSMPDGGLSYSHRANLKEKVCPFGFTDKAAGVHSEKANDATMWIGNKKVNVTKPVYFPQQTMNPINNGDIPLDHQIQLNRDSSKVQGAAGIASSRLTKMNGTWITDKDNSKPRAKLYDSIDVIAHTGEDPEQVRRGLKQFKKDDLTTAVSIGHYGGPPQPMSQEEVAKWSKMKQVRIRGGEYRYNVAGHEDRLPASTNVYTKADRPPSEAHRKQNDKMYLPKFYRKSADQLPESKTAESEDMAFILGERRDSESGVGYERQSMTSIQSYDGYIRPPAQMMRSASARQRTPPPRSRSNTPPPNERRRPRTPPPRPSYSESNYSRQSGPWAPNFTPPPRSREGR